MDKIPHLETHEGLKYLREARDRMTDEQLLELYEELKEIEHDAKYPWHEGYKYLAAHWRKHAKLPFDSLPCHRAIMIEVQGEIWVLERELEYGEKKRAQERERRIAQETARKLQQAKVSILRDL
ncbi:MAG: hypothetical protein CMB45_04860 [Euryarchaeota archaeon]|nr:hypothetical protein [Euryarchaeota archaeon]|tara:strand:+ start:2756 stop:3127 length:372 start_codon:yes stop_codon:yes gene_type:complete